MRLRLLAGVALLVLASVVAEATTYYVDPSGTCDDNNTGDVRTSPWCTPPGTRTANNGAFNSGGSWGSIDGTPKIDCGDVILLKGGSTQTSAQGGAWDLGPTYYTTTCTDSTRMTIQVADTATWGDTTSGPFTLNLAGVTPTFGNGVCTFTNQIAAGIRHGGIAYLQLKGASTSQQLIVRNSTSYTFASLCNNNELTFSGLRLERITFRDSTSGVGIGGLIGVLGKDLLIDGITNSSGLFVGMNSPHGRTRSIGFENVEIRASGAPTFTGNGDGFFAVDSHSLWAKDLYVHDNKQHGVNTGSVDDTQTEDYRYRFRNLRANRNGEVCGVGNLPGGCTGVDTPDHCCTGVGTGNCGGVGSCMGGGFDVSGDRGPGAGSECELEGCILEGTGRNVVQGGVIARNDDVGAMIYAYGFMELWNMVFWGNGLDRNLPDIGHDNSGNRTSIYNTFVQRRASPGRITFGNMGSSGACCGSAAIKPVVKHSTFKPVSANTESLANVDWSPCTDGNRNLSTHDYTSPPCFVSNSSAGENNAYGTSVASPAFVATSTCDTDFTDYPTATCDLHPTASSSPLINTGRCYFRTSGTGTGTTISGGSLVAQGGETDPRMYFISPWNAASIDMSMYLDSVGDTVVIGNDLVTIVSQTATSITFTPSITWANDECIMLKEFTGEDSLPEQGAYGYDSGAAPTTSTTSTTSTSSTSSTGADPTTSTTSTTSTSSTSTTTPPNLEAAWGLDEGSGFTVFSSVSSDNNGDVQGTGVGFTTGSRYGPSALTSPGTDARGALYLHYLESGFFGLAVDHTAVTIQAWVCPTVNNVWQSVYQLGGAGNSAALCLTNTGKARCSLRKNSTQKFIDSTSTIPTTGCTYLACRQNGSGLDVIVTSTLEATDSGAFTWNTGYAGHSMGNNPNRESACQPGVILDADEPFHGTWDEVRVYSTGQTTTQIEYDRLQPIEAPGRFGTDSVGGNTVALLADTKRGSKATLTEAGCITGLQWYLANPNASDQVAKVMVYSDGNSGCGGTLASCPQQLLATSAEITVDAGTAADWRWVPFTGCLNVTAGEYHLTSHTGATSGQLNGYAGATADARYNNTDTYADGPSNPFGTPTGVNVGPYSMFAVYRGPVVTASVGRPVELSPSTPLELGPGGRPAPMTPGISPMRWLDDILDPPWYREARRVQRERWVVSRWRKAA